VAVATGLYTIPSAPYLQALRLEKDDLVQALGLSFMVSSLSLASLLAHAGSLGMPAVGGSLLALVPAFIGLALGQWVRSRVQARAFRICFFLSSLALGVHLVVRGLV
jgi:uncharacterized membrane protein YfcA